MKKILKKFHSGQTGFTLIELLVVIAIIAVLAAIIVPNVGNYIGRGTTAAQQSELALMENAVAATMSGAAVSTMTPTTIVAGGDFTLSGPGGTFSLSDYFADGNTDDLKESYSINGTGAVTQTIISP